MRLNRDCLQGWEEGSDFISLVFCLVFFFFGLLGLPCCMRAFSTCGKRELLSSYAVRASYCRGFSCCRAQAPGTRALVVVAQALNCSRAHGILPKQGSNS